MLGKSIKAFWQTKTILSSMQMGAAGWEQRMHDPAVASGPVVFVYAHDVVTGWTWMGASERESFVRASEKASADKELTVAARAGCGHIISLAADGKPPTPESGLDWEQQLGQVLSLYAGTTKVWQVADHLRSGGHFVVLHYRAPGSREGMLRPFALPAGDNDVLTADELHALIRQVVTMDRTNHPEWFPKR